MATHRALIVSGVAGLPAMARSQPVWAAAPSSADRASDGEPWSIRDMLTDSLKN